MKKAFTIIELIFVIIVISILASIVLYKINSFRDDAFNISQVTNFKTLINDLNTYYVSNGRYFTDENGVNISKMTNVKSNNPYYYEFNSSDNKPCFILMFVKDELYIQPAFNPKKLPRACNVLNTMFINYNIDFSKEEYKSLLLSHKNKSGI